MNNPNIEPKEVTILRGNNWVPNGKEPDGSIHYDVFKATTDADLVYFHEYVKKTTAEDIDEEDSVETAIEKLDGNNAALEKMINDETTRAKSAESTINGKAQAAQNTANAAQNTANAANTAAQAAQQKADAAYALAEANKCKCSSPGGGSSGGESSVGDSNSDVSASFTIGSLVCWDRVPNGNWYATISLSWNLGKEVDSVSYSNAKILSYVNQIPYQGQGTMEIRVGSGNLNWIESFTGTTTTITFTVHAGSKTKTISQTVTIPAYSGQRKEEWTEEPSGQSVTVGDDWG